jgi:hypothetical protein
MAQKSRNSNYFGKFFLSDLAYSQTPEPSSPQGGTRRFCEEKTTIRKASSSTTQAWKRRRCGNEKKIQAYIINPCKL